MPGDRSVTRLGGVVMGNCATASKAARRFHRFAYSVIFVS